MSNHEITVYKVILENGEAEFIYAEDFALSNCDVTFFDKKGRKVAWFCLSGIIGFLEGKELVLVKDQENETKNI